VELSSVRAIRLFYAVAFFESLFFYAPVASLYRMEYGVTIFQITLIESVCFVITLLLEMPWGFVTARIGYKNTLVAAGALNLLAALLFWRADGFVIFLIQRCVLAVALSGFSGCDIAYLSRLTRPEARHKTLGRYNAVVFMALSTVGLSFPLVRLFGYRTLALLTMICIGIGFVLRLWLPQIESEPQDTLPPRRQIMALWQVLKHNRRFLLVVVCGAMLCEVENTFTVFFASPAYQAAGISQNWYGGLNLSLNLIGMAGGLLSARLAKRGTGLAVAVCWLLALISAAALCLTQNMLALILFLPLLRLAAQTYIPCEQALKTKRTGKASRAVALSAYSMVTSLVGVSLGPLLGAGTGAALKYGFYIGACIIVLAAAIMFFVYGRTAKREGRLKL